MAASARLNGKNRRAPSSPEQSPLEPLSERLYRFYLEQDCTFRKLGLLLGISAMTVKRACDGKRLRGTTSYKIERLLRKVHAE